MGWLLVALLLIFPGLIIYPIFQRDEKDDDWFTAAFWTATISMGVNAWVALTLAELGLFSAGRVLVAMVVITVIVFALRLRGRQRLLPRAERPGVTNVVMMILVMLVASFLYFQPNKHLIGGRDPGVYVNTAVHIAKSGQIIVEDKALTELNPQFASEFAPVEGLYYGETVKSHLVPQLFHMYPAWLAVWYQLIPGGWFLATPVQGLLVLLALYALARSWGLRFSVVPVLILTINLGQMWYARSNFSEVMSQVFILAGVVAFERSYRSRNSYLAALGGLALGVTWLIRLDAPFFVVPFIGVTAYFWLSGRASDRWFMSGLVGLLLPVAHGTYHALVFAKTYATFNWGRGVAGHSALMIGAALFTVGAVIGLRLLVPEHVRSKIFGTVESFLADRWLTGCLLLLIVSVYAYYIRPVTNSPEMDWVMPWRTYNEESLVRLGWYTSGLGIILAGIGLVTALRRGNTESKPYLIAALVVTLYYLADMHITPDHPWAIRRLVTVTMPAWALLVGYAVEQLVDWAGSIRDRFSAGTNLGRDLALGCIVYIIIFEYATIKPFVTQPEFQGVAEQLDELAGLLPKDSLLLTSTVLAMPLRFQYDFEVLRLTKGAKPDPVKFFGQLRQWMDQGKQVRVISQPLQDTAGNGVRLVAEADFHFETKAIITGDRTFQRPTELKPLVDSLLIYRLESDKTPVYGRIDIGDYQDDILAASGVHSREREGDVTFRWTTGELNFPMNGVAAGQDLTVTMRAAGRSLNGDKPTVLRVNGTDLATWVVKPGFAEYKASVPAAVLRGANLIEIASPVFVPSEAMGSGDTRKLGIQLDWIEINPVVNSN